MQSHEAHRWLTQAEREEWPQNLQVSYVNDPDGFFRGNWSVKDKDTGQQYTTNEQVTALSERNNRYAMD